MDREKCCILFLEDKGAVSASRVCTLGFKSIIPAQGRKNISLYCTKATRYDQDEVIGLYVCLVAGSG